MSSTSDTASLQPVTAPFRAGVRAAWTSVFSLVLTGTFVGIGALAHDFGFSFPWLVASTLLVWAGPAQVILITALGSGAAFGEVAVAVGLSSVRLLPMVIALLPLLRTTHTRIRDLVLPAHYTAVSMWIESLRLLPALPREQRVPFANGIGTGFLVVANAGSAVGYYLAANLPPTLTAAVLFVTPLTFLVSTARNARVLVDRLALALGLIIGPLLVWQQVELDLVWTGVIGGTVAYALHRLRGALA